MTFRTFSMITLEDAIILPSTSGKMQHLRFSVASMTTLMQRIMCVIKENIFIRSRKTDQICSFLL